jgi:hypothetical protein
MRNTRIGRSTRDRFPYRSFICAIINTAYFDEIAGKNVDWGDIPWAHQVDVSIPQVKRAAKNDGPADVG